MMLTAALAVLSLLAPQEQPGRVRLTITGAVVDDRLRPLAGVGLGIVAAPGEVGPALAAPRARSAADGTFALDVDAERAAHLEFAIGGAGQATQMLSLPTARDATIAIGAFAMTAGFAAAGRVRDTDGKPIAGALITVTDLLDDRPFLAEQRDRDQPAHRTSARSDEQGIFRLPGMVRSAGRLQADHAGHFAEVLEPAGLGTPLDVVMARAPEVRVRVVDGGGAPCVGAVVFLGDARIGKTDADGRLATWLRIPGPARLRASVQIAGAWTTSAAAVPAEGGDVEIAIVPAASSVPVTVAGAPRLRVQARAPDGTPVAAFRALLSWNPVAQLRYRPDAEMLARLRTRESEWSVAAVDGIATFAGAAPTERNDTGFLFVLADGHGLGRLQIDRSALGGEPIVVSLPEPTIVRGRVVDAGSGQPLAGVMVIPTQRLDDKSRAWYSNGFWDLDSLAGGPTCTVTDADGRYELCCLRPGTTDVFVHAPTRMDQPPRTLELVEGETRSDVDMTIPNNVTLQARLRGQLPPGAQVRAHWHRPNMSSSLWPRDFSGAVPVADDGSFALPDLHPKAYELQLLVPAPPRGGRRLKLLAAIWDGAKPADPPRFDAPVAAQIEGSVAGDVPWQRLGVAALWPPVPNHFTSSYQIGGPFALLNAERRFRVFAPPHAVHLLLFDILTGVALEWIPYDAGATTEPPVFEGRAVAVALSLVARHPAAAGAICEIEHIPETAHWPFGVGDFAPRAFLGVERNGMKCPVRTGSAIQYWVRDRSGVLQVTCGGTTVTTLQLAVADAFEVSVGGGDR